VNNLTAATTYLYYVVAFDAAGNYSGNSSQISITTDSPPTGPVIVHEGYFESGWDGWSDGGNDVARYSGSRSYEGNYSIRIRDNSGTASAMTSPSFDLSGFSEVTIDFHFYSHSMENNEDFWLRINNGSGWQTLETYARGTDFQNNNFYAVSYTVPSNMLSNTVQFRFQNDASGNNDHIYIDQVIITGTNGSNLRMMGTPSTIELVKSNIVPPNKNLTQKTELNIIEQRETIDLMDLMIAPNPAYTNTNIVIAANENTDAIIRLVSLYGETKLVMKERLMVGKNQISLDVSSLPKGSYMVVIETAKNKLTKKLLVL